MAPDLRPVVLDLAACPLVTPELARSDDLRGPVFTARNAAWIPRLEAAFAQPGFHAAVFGAGHLLGEDGVVALLRARGWTVVACPNDACS